MELNTEQVMQFGDVKIKLHWNEDGTALYPVELDIGDGFTWYVTSKKPKGEKDGLERLAR